MVTIAVRPDLRYSPLSILCEKRPEPSFPTSLTPFALAVLLALQSSKEGLAAISMLIVLAMPVTFSLLGGFYPSFVRRGRGMFRPRSQGE
jgi:hypothetical protein